MPARLIGALICVVALVACSEEEVPQVTYADPRVEVVAGVELGRSPGGWILSARAADARGTVERLSFEPAGRSGSVLRFNLLGAVTEQVAPGLVPTGGQSTLAALFVPDATLAGITTIEVRGANGSASVAVPVRVAAE